MRYRYIDFDDVVLATSEILFKEWEKNLNCNDLPLSEKVKYIGKSDWHKIIKEAREINDSLYILKHMSKDEAAVLTKVHSLENEGYEKIKFLRSKSVKLNIFLVPYNIRKVDVVNPYGCILIDDCLKNLDEWVKEGGNAMFFDYNLNNIDNWGKYNSQGYQRVLRIDEKMIK